MMKQIIGMSAKSVEIGRMSHLTPTRRTSTFVTLAEESFPTTMVAQPHARRKQHALSAARNTAILQNTASANGKPMPKASAQKYALPAAK